MLYQSVQFRPAIIVLLMVVGIVSVETALAADPPEIANEVITAQSQRIEVMRRCAAATVAVFGLDGGGGGSGVIISPDGYALTNYHVSSACGDHMRCGLNDGKMYDAVIVGVDAVGDVALIKLLGRDDFPIAPMGDSSKLRAGQWCFSAGNPFGLAANRQPSISLGLVSGVNRYQYPSGTILEYADCIQTDAAVNPGNSGGPLFNLAGEIIGINGRCSFEKRGRINVGVGYAISINQIRTFLSLLKSGRLLDHATLGATVTTDESGKVVVSNILSNSDAYRRGLRYGDEVVRFADREVTTTNSFKNILGTLPKDLRVPIEFKREGKSQTILARLVGVHTSSQLNRIVEMGLGGQPEEHKPKPGGKPQKPGDEKKPEKKIEEKPDDKPIGKPEPETDDPSADLDPKSGKLLPGVPDAKLAASMIELREGFSNYYFNRQIRQQLANQMKVLGDFRKATSIRVKGKLAGEATKVDVFTVGQQMDITVGSRRSQYKGDISDVISERKFGGIAVAYRALKELLQLGPDKIGETVYLGQFPVYAGKTLVLSEQHRHDVLESSWYDSRVRFHWNADAGQVSLVEIFGDDGTDPAEVYFDQYRPVRQGEAEYSLPGRVRLQYGTDILMAFEIEEYELGGNSPPASNSSSDAAKSETPKSDAIEPARDSSKSDKSDATEPKP